MYEGHYSALDCKHLASVNVSRRRTGILDGESSGPGGGGRGVSFIFHDHRKGTGSRKAIYRAEETRPKDLVSQE
jgi:hypothetical protein